MLTKLEAKDRAAAIWGKRNVKGMSMARDRWEWWVDIRSDDHIHAIDGNGHATCHKACAELEDKIGAKPTRSLPRKTALATKIKRLDKLMVNGGREDVRLEVVRQLNLVRVLVKALGRLVVASSISESDCAYDQDEQDAAHAEAQSALALAARR